MVKTPHHRFLIVLVAVFSIFAAYVGIYSSGGPGAYLYESIRGQDILIYGSGVYQHMSSQVAVQGIAQDYVTLYIAIPLLLLSFYMAHLGKNPWEYILTGIVAYFFVTYLFYLNIAMYNKLFLIYVVILSTSFFLLLERLTSQFTQTFVYEYSQDKYFNGAGIFLMLNSITISLLWLSNIIPPLLDGTIIPNSVEHYTTLVVQGFDLALFLPISFFAGYRAWKKMIGGSYFALISCIFLTFLMLALCAKILFMGVQGANIIPAVFIMPVITFTSGFFAFKMLKALKNG